MHSRKECSPSTLPLPPAHARRPTLHYPHLLYNLSAIKNSVDSVPEGDDAMLAQDNFSPSRVSASRFAARMMGMTRKRRREEHERLASGGCNKFVCARVQEYGTVGVRGCSGSCARLANIRNIVIALLWGHHHHSLFLLSLASLRLHKGSPLGFAALGNLRADRCASLPNTQAHHGASHLQNRAALLR